MQATDKEVSCIGCGAEYEVVIHGQVTSAIIEIYARDIAGDVIVDAWPGEEFELVVKWRQTFSGGPVWLRARDKDTGAIIVNKWGEVLETTYSWSSAGEHFEFWSGIIMPNKPFNILVEVGHDGIRDDDETLTISLITAPPPEPPPEPPPPPEVTPGTIVLTVSVYEAKDPTRKLEDAIVTVNTAQKRTGTGGIAQFTAGDITPADPYNPWRTIIIKVEKPEYERKEETFHLSTITLKEIGLSPTRPIWPYILGGVAFVGGIGTIVYLKRRK